MYQPTDTLTHSKILAFTCPARYDKLHNQGLRDDSDPARRGSTIHTANERYLQMLVTAKQTSDPDLAALALHEAIVTETTPAHLIPDCEYLWQNHVERFELDLDAFLEAEERRVVGPYSFKPDFAYITLGAVEIHDLKTHYQALTAETARKDLQARMYCYLASQVWPGWTTYRFVWHFIRLNQIVTTDFTLADLDRVERQLQAHAASIEQAAESHHYPAAPGAQCAYCTFVCPEVDHAAKAPARILTAIEAERIAENLVVLQQAVSQQRRVLEQYTGLHGPVVAADHEWGHRPVERRAYPVEGVLEILRRWGGRVDSLTVGSSALRSYLTTKKWAHVAPELAAISQTKTGTQFGAKRLLPAEEGDDETGE